MWLAKKQNYKTSNLNAPVDDLVKGFEQQPTEAEIERILKELEENGLVLNVGAIAKDCMNGVSITERGVEYALA
jgi:hypothetical protein